MQILFHNDNTSILERLVSGHLDTKEWFDLKTQAERLGLTEGFERLLTLDSLALDLYDHQRQAVLRVLREMRGRAVLADEVGLGKTIEAGVVLKEYILRSLVNRVLILVPASLVSQWRSELRYRLDLTFRVGRKPEDFARSRVLASIDTAKRPSCRDAVWSTKWDMVIVDEAHRLKNRKTLNWQFVNGVQKKYLLLLTATPIQNDLRELYNLITLLKPGQLETYPQFKRAFMIDKHSPKNTATLKQRLSEVMVRTGRRESLIPFPKRHVRTITVALSEAEREYYNQTLTRLRTAYRAMPKDERNLLPLILVLREACSHPRAAHQTLRAMAARNTMPTISTDVVDELGAAIRTLQPAKMEALRQCVGDTDGRCIVFTEFRVTQRELVRSLSEAGFAVYAFHGGLSPQEKDRVVEAFRDFGGILVSTEAGGEGRNLQFCNTVVNYDLPWNPMRIEQRIGRVHRLGQKDEVHVVNLVTEETIDAYVLYLLDKKIGMFHRVVGEIDEILANLERRFEESMADVALASGDDEEMARKVEAFGRELERAYHRYDRIRRLNSELLDGEGGSQAISGGKDGSSGKEEGIGL